ncbi:hypothetical protein ETAA8_05480 [Anatilimnocola aggregata]|uniref:DUF1552 domain-containing protein n=1 Tax=Anatilimnocola aggregata TaxID=2528021 RepID=A0A517Y5K7_9BACT|nr:DUF1552 domain-containing protein [Anatilimnocola aggregata]QDU25480.1 hypothetical protein ETAA8_05480 [Anatilimnocola aggregata]
MATSTAVTRLLNQSSRRSFLRAAGVTLALPMLDALQPKLRAGEKKVVPRRMVCICTPLSVNPNYFFPTDTGRDYTLSPYLEPLAELRNDFSVISGLSHPDVGSSHDSIFSFLTAAPHPEIRAGFRNSISLDQFAAEHLGGQTRFPSLSLSAEGFGLSWTRSGALVPPDLYPASVFAKMFLDGRPDEVESQKRRLRNGKSILDTLHAQAKQLNPAIGTRDREKLDEYFTSVRELEQRMVVQQEWANRPKPKVDAKQPANNMNSADLIGKNRLMFDLIHLAIQTDSTRLITMLLLGTSNVPPIQGISAGHHDLSHHGQDPKKIEQLKILELEKMKTVQELLSKLKNTQEEGESLLDRTMVYFSSNLGNASNHSTKNLPILFAGGGFNHGQHLAFDPKSPPPLSNLYLSMLHRLGIPSDKFGSSSGTLTGLAAKA